MLFTLFCTVLCWRRTKVGLILPLQLLGSWANWRFGETMQKSSPVTAFNLCSIRPFQQSRVLWRAACPFILPHFPSAVIFSVFSIASSVWKATGCRRMALINQCNAIREISSWYCYFLMKISTGFTLLSWNSYCLLQSRIDVFSWSSKIIWVCISDVGGCFGRVFLFVMSLLRPSLLTL